MKQPSLKCIKENDGQPVSFVKQIELNIIKTKTSVTNVIKYMIKQKLIKCHGFVMIVLKNANTGKRYIVKIVKENQRTKPMKIEEIINVVITIEKVIVDCVIRE
jgi:hypothetical protein